MVSFVTELLRDIMSQQVPGSVVLLILAIVMFREAVGLWMRWASPKRRHYDG